MEKLVRCKDVCKSYSKGELEVRALIDVNLTLTNGEFVSICGPSGSGKSTLLNLVGGLDTVTSGEIHFDCARLDQMSAAQLAELRLRKIGFIFQAYNLIPVLSALENVEFVMQLQGVAANERAAKAREMIALVGLCGMEKRRPGELSGGQQQRVAIARAIVSHPQLVLADEPTANLDSKTARSLLELMEKLNHERKITFVFSTHDVLVMEFARRLLKLHDGAIVSDEVRR